MSTVLLGCVSQTSLNQLSLELSFGGCCHQDLLRATVTNSNESKILRQLALVREANSITMVVLDPLARTRGQCRWTKKKITCHGPEQALSERLFLAVSLELSKESSITLDNSVLMQKYSTFYAVPSTSQRIQLTQIQSQPL